MGHYLPPNRRHNSTPRSGGVWEPERSRPMDLPSRLITRSLFVEPGPEDSAGFSPLRTPIDITGRAPKLVVDCEWARRKMSRRCDYSFGCHTRRKSCWAASLMIEDRDAPTIALGVRSDNSMNSRGGRLAGRSDLTTAARVDSADLHAEPLRCVCMAAKIGPSLRDCPEGEAAIRLCSLDCLKKPTTCRLFDANSKIMKPWRLPPGFASYRRTQHRRIGTPNDTSAVQGGCITAATTHCAAGQNDIWRRKRRPFCGVFALQRNVVFTPSNVKFLRSRPTCPSKLCKACWKGRDARHDLRPSSAARLPEYAITTSLFAAESAGIANIHGRGAIETRTG